MDVRLTWQGAVEIKLTIYEAREIWEGGPAYGELMSALGLVMDEYEEDEEHADPP